MSRNKAEVRSVCVAVTCRWKVNSCVSGRWRWLWLESVRYLSLNAAVVSPQRGDKISGNPCPVCRDSNIIVHYQVSAVEPLCLDLHDRSRARSTVPSRPTEYYQHYFMQDFVWMRKKTISRTNVSVWLNIIGKKLKWKRSSSELISVDSHSFFDDNAQLADAAADSCPHSECQVAAAVHQPPDWDLVWSHANW